MKLKKNQQFEGIITLKGKNLNVAFIPSSNDSDDNTGVLTIQPTTTPLTYKSALKFLESLEDVAATTTAATPATVAPAPPNGSSSDDNRKSRQQTIPGTTATTPSKPATAPATPTDSRMEEYFKCPATRQVVGQAVQELGGTQKATYKAAIRLLKELKAANVPALQSDDWKDNCTMALEKLGIKKIIVVDAVPATPANAAGAGDDSDDATN